MGTDTRAAGAEADGCPADGSGAEARFGSGAVAGELEFALESESGIATVHCGAVGGGACPGAPGCGTTTMFTG